MNEGAHYPKIFGGECSLGIFQSLEYFHEPASLHHMAQNMGIKLTQVTTLMVCNV